MMKISGLYALGVFVVAGVLPVAAYAEESYMVESTVLKDHKSSFATVEGVDTIPARARISGTIASLSVTEGDAVKAGDEIALVGDDKLALQVKSIDAQIQALKAENSRAQAEWSRARALMKSASISKSAYDGARAAAKAASSSLEAQQAQRAVIEQQMADGRIFAPVDGRVLNVPTTIGSVIMPGEAVATIATADYVVRLKLPERQMRFLKVGGTVRLEGDDVSGISKDKSAGEGRIKLVYPQIQNGMVMADAVVPGLQNFYVGQRVLVSVPTTERKAIIVPDKFLMTRSGMDYVHLKSKDGKVYQVPVQRGDVDPNVADHVEILSGVREGDVLMMPQE